jgi:hypothetical protein
MCQVSYVAITKKQHAHAKAASSDFFDPESNLR